MRVGLVLQAAPSGADKIEKIKVIRFAEVCTISNVGTKSFANTMIQYAAEKKWKKKNRHYMIMLIIRLNYRVWGCADCIIILYNTISHNIGLYRIIYPIYTYIRRLVKICNVHMSWFYAMSSLFFCNACNWV